MDRDCFDWSDAEINAAMRARDGTGPHMTPPSDATYEVVESVGMRSRTGVFDANRSVRRRFCSGCKAQIHDGDAVHIRPSRWTGGIGMSSLHCDLCGPWPAVMVTIPTVRPSGSVIIRNTRVAACGCCRRPLAEGEYFYWLKSDKTGRTRCQDCGDFRADLNPWSVSIRDVQLANALARCTLADVN